MKANQSSRFSREEGAQIGVGTLIIFIAMVLVAAVAAAVLINTSGVLQQKAQSTGKEATEEVSSNIEIGSVVGDRAEDTGNTSADQLNDSIQLLEVKIKPSAGSAPIDIAQVVITVSDGKTRKDITYNATGTLDSDLTWNTGANATYNGTNTFIAEEVRDEDNSFNKENNPVINSGDLIKLYIDTSSASGLGLDLDARSNLKITLRPETGTPVGVDLVTPNSYGVNRYVDLYP